MEGRPVRQQALGLRARVGAGTHRVSKLWSRGGLGLRAFSRSPYSSHHGGKTVKTTVGRLITGVFALALLLGGFGLMHDTAQAQVANVFIQAGGGGDTSGDDAVSTISYILSCDPYPERKLLTPDQGTATLYEEDINDDNAPDDNEVVLVVDSAETPTLGSTTAGQATCKGNDNVFTIKTSTGDGDPTVGDGEENNAPIEVLNTSLPKSEADEESPGTTPGDNPRIFTVAENLVSLVAVPRTTNLRDNEIMAFSGNALRVTFTPANSLGVVKTLTIDNVKPTLVTMSPTVALVAKKGVDVTFAADFTDRGSGYTTTNTNTAGINKLTGVAGVLVEDDNDDTAKGGVRLVVAGNVVPLAKGDFEAIDGGWRVSKTLNSTTIEAVNENTPWYFETRDRAGNRTRTPGGIALKPKNADIVGGTRAATAVTGATVKDGRFAGLHANTFIDGGKIRVTRGASSKTVSFTYTVDGTLTLETLTADNFFTAKDFDDDSDDATPDVAAPTTLRQADNDATPKVKADKFELVGVNLITVDGVKPALNAADVITGIVWRSASKTEGRGLTGKVNSIRLKFTDGLQGSGLDSASVTASAFTVSGNTVNSVLVVGSSVYLTLGTDLASDEQPTVSIAGGVIMDKAGNEFAAQRISKAVDGLGPNLSLSEDSDLSKTKVTVTINTDEQLGRQPTVVLSRVINAKSGAVAGPNALVCDDDATEDEVELDIVASAAVCDKKDVLEDEETDAIELKSFTAVADPRQPAGQPSAVQATSLMYTYTAAPAVNPDGETGGKYNVYVVGSDTHAVNDNEGKAGHKSNANHSSAFTFQIDTAFNDGGDPVVTVSEETATSDVSNAPEVEMIAPMIITVNFAGEGKEYPGDSYRTVTLTSAKMKITFSDGSSESRTFDLATEISTENNREYTIPVLNPKVGTYTLTVKGEDSAGNESGVSGHSASWDVVAAKPVKISLQPGWNLISLPFQPANPAINSVIPSDHPITLVMTYDSAEGVWLFSRRDAETGLFTGDVAAMTATGAYFVNTDSYKTLDLFQPPSATAVAAPAQPPAIPVKKGWNLVPVSSSQSSGGLEADKYFGTLGKTWLRALAWNSLTRVWTAVSPGDTVHTFDKLAEDESADDQDGHEDRCGVTHDYESEGTVPAQVCVGEGLWLWVTEDGTLIPG